MFPVDTGDLWHMGNVMVWLLCWIFIAIWVQYMFYHNVKIRKANNGVNLNLPFELIEYLILLKPQHKILIKK